MNHRYEISRTNDIVSVYYKVHDLALRKVAHRIRHSPTGFEYGYGGSGPADLARSILWDHLGTEPTPALYQAFKQDFIENLNPNDSLHLIDVESITAWLGRQAEQGLTG